MSSYYDAAHASGDWAGVDLRAARTVTAIAYAPRNGFSSRMVGGVVQSADDPNGPWTTRHTVAVGPPWAKLTTAALAAPVSARCWRYVGPDGSYCNVAELQLIGPAVAAPADVPAKADPTADPVRATPPTPQPVTPQPVTTGEVALKVGVGSRQTTAAGATVGMAPVAAWGDLRGVADVSVDEISWDFGDADAKRYPDPRHAVDPDRYPATYSPDADLHGAVEGYVYERPGTYTITATVRHPDGSTAVASNTVVVAADARAHQTFGTGDDAAFAAFLGGRPNVWATVRAGTTLNVAGATIRLASGAVVEGEADAAGDVPAIVGGKGSTFDTWTDGYGVVVRRLRAEGATTPLAWKAADPLTLAGSSNTFLSNRGNGVAVYECQIGTVGCLYKGNSRGPSAGVLVARNVQLDRTATSAGGVVFHGVGVAEQVIAEWGGGMQSWQGNTILGSLWQSPTRSDGVGACDGFSYEFNDVRNNALQHKALLTNRNASDSYVGHNLFRDGQVAASTTIGSTDTRVCRARYDDNLGVGQSFEFGPRSDHVAITRNRLTKAGTGAGSGYGIQLGTNAAGGLHDVRVAGNVGESAVAKVFGRPVTGLAADVKVDGN